MISFTDREMQRAWRENIFDPRIRHFIITTICRTVVQQPYLDVIDFYLPGTTGQFQVRQAGDQRPFTHPTTDLFDVGWVEGRNGGPSAQTFPVTSYLNKSSGRPAILTRNPPTGQFQTRLGCFPLSAHLIV